MNKYRQQKEKARQKAIEYSTSYISKNLSYYEIYIYYNKFLKLAKRYGLIKEFKENCII